MPDLADGKLVEGYVIIARATYKKSDTFRALTLEQKGMAYTMILMANHGDRVVWNGRENITVKRGQFFTSLPSLVETFGKGATIQKVRTCLTKLDVKNLGFLTDEPTGNGRLITLINYDFWETQENYLTAKSTGRQQAPNRSLTANKHVKHLKQEDPENTIVDFVAWFNQEFGTSYRVKTYKLNIEARLAEFTVEQLKQAALAMKRNPHMMGQNDRHTVYATLEYITRNDKNVDKFLNLKQGEGGQAHETYGATGTRPKAAGSAEQKYSMQCDIDS